MLDLKSMMPWGASTRSGDVAQNDNLQPDPVTLFRRDMDYAFDQLMTNWAGSPIRFSPSRGTPSALALPALDVDDGEEALTISVELPGVDETDVALTVVGDVLTISGKKPHLLSKDGGRLHYAERRYGAFTRQLRLPFPAGNQDIKANFDKGVLTITVAKPAEAQASTRQIPIAV